MSGSDCTARICRTNCLSPTRCSVSPAIRAAIFVRPTPFASAPCGRPKIRRAKKISSDIVDSAANDLGLWPTRKVLKENAKTSMVAGDRPFSAPRSPAAPRERITPQEHAATKTLLDYSGTEDRRRPGERGRRSLFIGSLIIIVYIVIAGVWLYSDTARQAVGALGGKLEDIATTGKAAMENTASPSI